MLTKALVRKLQPKTTVLGVTILCDGAKLNSTESRPVATLNIYTSTVGYEWNTSGISTAVNSTIPVQDSTSPTIFTVASSFTAVCLVVGLLVGFFRWLKHHQMVRANREMRRQRWSQEIRRIQQQYPFQQLDARRHQNPVTAGSSVQSVVQVHHNPEVEDRVEEFFSPSGSTSDLTQMT